MLANCGEGVSAAGLEPVYENYILANLRSTYNLVCTRKEYTKNALNSWWFGEDRQMVEFDVFSEASVELSVVEKIGIDFGHEPVFCKGSDPTTQIQYVAETALDGSSKETQLRDLMSFLMNYCESCSRNGQQCPLVVFVVITGSNNRSRERILKLLSIFVAEFGEGRVARVFESIGVMSIPCMNEKMVEVLVAVSSQLQQHALEFDHRLDQYVKESHEQFADVTSENIALNERLANVERVLRLRND